MRKDIKDYLDNILGDTGADQERALIYAHEELVIGWNLSDKQADKMIDEWNKGR